MLEVDELEKVDILTRILKSDFPEEVKDKNTKVIEELLDLLGKYKVKRKEWEFKLRINDDPRRHDFYATMARLAMLDMIIADLTDLKRFLEEAFELWLNEII